MAASSRFADPATLTASAPCRWPAAASSCTVPVIWSTASDDSSAEADSSALAPATSSAISSTPRINRRRPIIISRTDSVSRSTSSPVPASGTSTLRSPFATVSAASIIRRIGLAIRPEIRHPSMSEATRPAPTAASDIFCETSDRSIAS